MISQTLRDARKYEEINEKKIRQEERPDFHLSTRVGWMNDPNGFSYYDGKYHLFYQYNPYESRWGSMHWGHAVSTDLLHWEYCPAALAPDEAYDKDGCFSGSAETLEDGRQLLMYTGVQKKTLPDGSVREEQTQCVAVGDGTDYVKYEKNPVITSDMLPQGCSKYDFRDPKIWKEADGTFYCVVGNRPQDGSGQILLFVSKDGFDWKFKSVLAENRNRYGKMWECPDFFKLDDKWVLFTSPQDMLPKDLEYHNGYGTLCLIGAFDEKSGMFTEHANQSIDYGIDFYAPQTILTPDGRRVMIGWMQNWDTCSIRGQEEPWFGQMSLARELEIKNGRLYQKPVRELERMRCNRVSYSDVPLNGFLTLDGICGRRIDLEIVLRPKQGEELLRQFEIRFAQDERFYTSFSFKTYESVLKIDRKFSGSTRTIVHQRRSLLKWAKDELKFRLILDRYSAEIFVNDGEQVLTVTMYTDQSADGIKFFADGTVNMDVTKYDLCMQAEGSDWK
ncbi:MAG: glycoside hydrolase family 32 protein [Lachnospiraceae bacterium]|jgi:beta-fructofuranosidase|nr:glycoside hydrolase family 32 protein [Lachnospiraceae bacterium]